MANSLRGNTWHHFLKDTSSKGLQKTIRKKKQQHSAEPTKAGTSVKVVWPFKRAWVRDIKLNPLWGPFLQRKSRHVSENCGCFETHPNERMWVKLQPTPFFWRTVMSLIDSTDFRISGGFYPPEKILQDMSLDLLLFLQKVPRKNLGNIHAYWGKFRWQK